MIYNNSMKTILITGASSGIGKACAEAAAKNGYTVLAGHRKDSDAKTLKEIHQNIRPLKIDITDQEQREQCFKLIEREYSSLDCLFNNAGISGSGPAEFQSLEMYRHQMEINFIAPVAMTQTFLPLIRKSQAPRILFTSSAAGLLAKPMMASYSASKFALESFIDTIRMELAPWNIKISAFEPGKIKTQIYKKSLEQAQEQQQKLPPQALELYKPLFDVAMYNIKNADSMSGSVDDIVKVFLDALLSKNPKTRYPYGGDAASQAFIAKWLPDKTRDKLIAMKMNSFLKKANNSN
jgi:NAD(P)-dependent dehydrogenase (short-subunit alcohol dehydrogenase family)